MEYRKNHATLILGIIIFILFSLFTGYYWIHEEKKRENEMPESREATLQSTQDSV